MTQHLAESFVDLRCHGLAAESLTKLGLDHVKGRLYVAALVKMAQKFFAVLHVETKPSFQIGAIPEFTVPHSSGDNPGGREWLCLFARS